MVQDEVKIKRDVNLEVMSSEYGSDRLYWKKGDEKGEKDDDDDEKDGDEKAKSIEEKQPQVTEEEEVQESMKVAEVAKIDIVFFNQEEVADEAYKITYHLFDDNDSSRVTKYYTTSGDEEERDYDYPVDDSAGDDDSDEKKSGDNDSVEIDGDKDVDFDDGDGDSDDDNDSNNSGDSDGDGGNRDTGGDGNHGGADVLRAMKAKIC
ncbi:hypothetical protein GIB67_036516 [Kingdonia uniflora]|uniref:Uncharacterized protein n=1 Tax=Kingdonia uniflora TaxID=39325 RepID=A0A7J7P7K8_9MAGN|nr:hypothetical protein GIB67_036516 [Kingdonia uniflora]